MRLAIDLPPFGPFTDATLVTQVAAVAEEAGWNDFFLWDHNTCKRAGSPQPVAIADPWIHLAAVAMRTDNAQLAVERGFAFLKDPLFLATSAFVNSRGASWRWPTFWRCACSPTSSRSSASAWRWRSIPCLTNYVGRRPGRRCIGFLQRFARSELRHVTCPDGARATQVRRLSALHRQVLRLVGPADEQRHFASG